MSELLITNAHLSVFFEASPEQALRGAELSIEHSRSGQYILIRAGLIADIGPMENAPLNISRQIDASGRYVLPAWCDSHTHLVFSHTREHEFEMRLRGSTYEEIAQAGGGIINSALRLREMDESELFDHSYQRFQAVQRLGTGAIEIKSGYGLDMASELKMLRIIRRLKETNEIPVKATFLGAHAIPPEFKNDRNGYLNLVLESMLPLIADQGLADYIDAFCDQGFFTPDETARIIEAGARYGLKAKIHANELAVSGGVETGVVHGAVSVDHLERMDDTTIEVLSKSKTIGTMLPGCAFFLGLEYPRARDMITAGAALALATDYNPGTAPSGNMNFVVALACIKLKMTPVEAIHAATINGAFAMELDQQVGSLSIGKLANLMLTKKISSTAVIPYSFGADVIDQVILSGVPK